jgi:hypothetical protein
VVVTAGSSHDNLDESAPEPCGIAAADVQNGDMNVLVDSGVRDAAR